MTTLEATTTHVHVPGATGSSAAAEQGCDLGGSGSTVKLRRSHGEAVAVGTTGGRSALKQKTALCLGNPSGGGSSVLSAGHLALERELTGQTISLRFSPPIAL